MKTVALTDKAPCSGLDFMTRIWCLSFDIQKLPSHWPDYQRLVSKVLIIKGIVYCLWRLLTKDRVLKS